MQYFDCFWIKAKKKLGNLPKRPKKFAIKWEIYLKKYESKGRENPSTLKRNLLSW